MIRSSVSENNGYLTDPPQLKPAAPRIAEPVSDINDLAFPESLEPKGNLFLDPSIESGDSYVPPDAPSTYGVYARKHVSLDDENATSPATFVFAATVKASSQKAVGPPLQATYPPFELAKQYVDCYFFHNHTQAPFLHYTSFKQRFFAFYSTQFIDQQPHWVFIFNMYINLSMSVRLC